MALYFCRASEAFPGARWSPSDDHLAAMSGNAVIGTLKRALGGRQDGQWIWSITVMVAWPREIQRHGTAHTREAAQAAFAERWQEWLAWVGLRETEEPAEAVLQQASAGPAKAVATLPSRL